MSEQTFLQTLISPPVLLTFIACAALAALAIWLYDKLQRRRHEGGLSQQRAHQEVTIQRLLDSVADDKEQVIGEYETRIQAKDRQIAALEREIARLKDRLSSSGVLGLFGGKQRDVISALLLENEQLHELLTQKQEQMRDLMENMTGQLLARLDEQAQESARAVRYKQALLSAFLQQEDTKRLLDTFVQQGKLPDGKPTDNG